MPHPAPIPFAPQVLKLQQQGARLVFFGDDCAQSEAEARRAAAEAGATYISPYNDILVRQAPLESLCLLACPTLAINVLPKSTQRTAGGIGHAACGGRPRLPVILSQGLSG
jgi:hypothetical protein